MPAKKNQSIVPFAVFISGDTLLNSKKLGDASIVFLATYIGKNYRSVP